MFELTFIDSGKTINCSLKEAKELVDVNSALNGHLPHIVMVPINEEGFGQAAKFNKDFA